MRRDGNDVQRQALGELREEDLKLLGVEGWPEPS